MSTVVYAILQEEKERNLKMQETYRKEIEKLPKGTIVTKKVRGNSYFYLKYRQHDKIKTDYLGKEQKTVENTRKQLEKRKYLQNVLKRLREEYKQICKIVKD